MNKNNDEKLIRDMYEKINTPEYDASKDVLKKIQPKYHQKVVLKRVIILGIILCLGAVALGAVKLIVAKMVNFDGEISQFEYQPNPIKPTQPPETVNEDIYIDEVHEFTRAAKQGELRIVIDTLDSSASLNIPHIEVTDINDILEYAKNSNISFLFPQYMPEGYYFVDGRTSLFIGEESLNAELTYSETKDGKLYEIYLMPEGYEKNISSFSLNYSNNKGSRLTYTAIVMEREYLEESFDINLTEKQTAKSISIVGFEKCLIINDNSENAYAKNRAYLYNKAESVKAVSDFPYRMHPETLPEGIDTKENQYYTYSAVLYNISAQKLSEEEVIKIAESLN